MTKYWKKYKNPKYENEWRNEKTAFSITIGQKPFTEDTYIFVLWDQFKDMEKSKEFKYNNINKAKHEALVYARKYMRKH